MNLKNRDIETLKHLATLQDKAIALGAPPEDGGSFIDKDVALRLHAEWLVAQLIIDGVVSGAYAITNWGREAVGFPIVREAWLRGIFPPSNSVSKGRNRVSLETIYMIREAAAEGHSQLSLSELTGMSPQMISLIVARKAYKNV